MGPEKHPPSEGDIDTFGERPKMRMRFPVHLWAMLSRGREAESLTIEQLVQRGEQVEGVYVCMRWREFDGECLWDWRDDDGETLIPKPLSWSEFFVRRIVWVSRGGRWYGVWTLEEYHREEEWTGYSHRWSSIGQDWNQNMAVPAWGHLPQEVLLRMVERYGWVGAITSYVKSGLNHLHHRPVMTSVL